MNTTPNPRATKKSRGEEPELPLLLLPPPPPLSSPPLVDVGKESEVGVGVEEENPVEEDAIVGSDEALVRVLEACLTWYSNVRATRLANSWPSRVMTTILAQMFGENNSISFGEVDDDSGGARRMLP